MKNIILIIAALIMCFSVKAQNFSNAKIRGERLVWHPDSLLKWEYFQAKPKSAYGIAALSNIAIDNKAELINNRTVRVTIVATFNKYYSWAKEEFKDDYVLKHEQVHFDIYELYARKCRKEFTEAKFTYNNMQKKLPKLLYKYGNEAVEYQKKYDEETKHSIIESKQEEWNIKIAEELKELEEYAIQFVDIKAEK
jgi:hypothetical protein